MYSPFFSIISIACILSLPSSRGFTTWSTFLLHSMATPLYSLWVSTSILADYICPHLSQQMFRTRLFYVHIKRQQMYRKQVTIDSDE
jgi:capsid protein